MVTDLALLSQYLDLAGFGLDEVVRVLTASFIAFAAKCADITLRSLRFLDRFGCLASTLACNFRLLKMANTTHGGV